MRFKDKTAIVTGGAKGIGKACVERLMREKAKVAVIDFDAEALEQLKTDDTDDLLTFCADVSKEENWIMITKKVIALWGRIDILINNAGVSTRDKCHECSLDFWKEMLDCNLTSQFLGMKSCIPYMMENNQGSIVNLSSVGAFVGIGGGTVYPASKGAVWSMSRRAAIDYGKYGIRVNVVIPGWVETPMSNQARPEKKQQFLDRQALKYFGKPEDAAAAILFLASDDARFISGSEIRVDGGFLAG